jgi:hypothetical protein
MPCTCRNAHPDSLLPPGADGCAVNPDAARRELAREAETLRHLLTTPAVLSTQALLLLMPSSSERLLMRLAPGSDHAALVPAESKQPEGHTTAHTTEKENLNGYL